MAKVSEWTARLLAEARYWPQRSFITLTYAPETLPPDGSLEPKHLQDFFKRLRKDTKAKIRYFSCGEYGGLFGRPHYHAILFGLDEDSLVIQRIWGKGQADSRTCCEGTIKYVAGYTLKKQYSLQTSRRASEGLRSEFLRCSKGLGLRYAQEHKAELLSGRLNRGGYSIALPRYFARKLNVDMAAIVAQRKAPPSLEALRVTPRSGLSLGAGYDDRYAFLHELFAQRSDGLSLLGERYQDQLSAGYALAADTYKRQQEYLLINRSQANPYAHIDDIARY